MSHVALLTTRRPAAPEALAALPPGSLALRHRARAAGPDWSGLICVPLESPDTEAVRSLATELDGDLVRAALGRVQPGLDMWSPGSARGAAVHITEYIRSDPAHRAEYYGTQLTASGPAMRELWETGLVQRFVGVEVIDDVVPGPGEPWDLLHVTSFSLRRLPRMLRWRREFDRHAQAAGFADMKALSALWSTQRTMDQVRSTLLLAP